MKLKYLLLIAGALACATGGFLLAQRFDRTRSEKQLSVSAQDSQREVAALRTDAEAWANAVATAEGESLLRAFVTGISPAVLVQRREAVELASVGLLHVTGVAGIHVLGVDGAVWYSSDAKLTATGDAQYRGSWALQATELASRPSPRPGIMEYAMPIANSGSRIAVVWLEYDVERVRDTARPVSMGRPPGREPAAPDSQATGAETVTPATPDAPSEVDKTDSRAEPPEQTTQP